MPRRYVFYCSFRAEYLRNRDILTETEVVCISTQLEYCVQWCISHALGKMEIFWNKSREGKKRSYEKNGKMGLVSLENGGCEKSFNI